ncbi:MAG: GreA/GreB family elongation factor [Chloroflexi bacterium]|nr:GreA/GreB family elongation factor [Chloroflexota bacterium]
MLPSADITLAQTSARYLAGLPPEKRAAEQGELNKFIRWCGSDRPVAGLSVHNVASYAETASAWGGDVTQRLEPVRSFLLFLKQQKISSVNLATHLKWRKGTVRASPPPRKKRELSETEASALSLEGRTQIETDLAALRAERPQLAEEIRHAAADKDFRENSPLDAAKERQAHVEGRIRNLETLLHLHTMAEATGDKKVTAKANLGSRLVLHDLTRDQEMRCTLVSPAEASPREGKVSSTSPLGKALLDKGPGEVVEVTAPAGKFHYLIEAVEG